MEADLLQLPWKLVEASMEVDGSRWKLSWRWMKLTNQVISVANSVEANESTSSSMEVGGIFLES